VLVIAVLAGAIPIMMPRNYGLYSIVTTPLAVILVEVHAGASASLVGARLLDTLVGCVIVLVFGYLLWPSTWHAPRHLAAGVADAVRSVEGYLDIALGRQRAVATDDGTAGDARAAGRPDDERVRTTARRATYRELSDLRTRVARSLAEPPVVSSAAASWMPEITALEAVTDAVTAAATTTAASSEAVDRSDVEGSRRVLADLAEAIVEGRRPGTAPVPTTGALTGLGDALTTARAALPSHERTPATHHARGTAAPDGAA
jgi:uncharacterized membrane protein YccC